MREVVSGEPQPMETLRQEIRAELGKLSDLGFLTSTLDSIVSASQTYRRDSLFYVKTRDRELSEEENREEYAIHRASYDGLSADNIIETIRYQYDRETKESKLDREEFPSAKSTEFESALQIVKSLETSLKDLQKRIPDFSAFRENLRMLSTSPAQLIEKSKKVVSNQLVRDASDEEKVGEIIFELNILRKYLTKCSEQGDRVPDEVKNSVESLIEKLTALESSGEYGEVLQYASEIHTLLPSLDH